VFLDEVLANAAQEIVEACNGDFMCIFDYNQTGNADVGMATLMTNQNNVNDRTLACKCSSDVYVMLCVKIIITCLFH